MRARFGTDILGRALVGLVLVAAATGVGVAWAQEGEELDPARNVALPCEALGTPGAIPRSARNIAHLANVCGFVGTDVEFQSRQAADGVHDYAFVGTMGGGLRIFDVTDPAHPHSAGAYTDPGWQGDVQVRGDLAAIGFDPLSGSAPAPAASACLQAKGANGGVDLVRLSFDAQKATFSTSLVDCVPALPGGGAHNSTIHPSGQWLAMSNPRGQGSVDVVDLRSSPPRRVYRIVQNATLANAACAGAAAGQCISNGRAGTWSPHDISFSRDGSRMYVAAVGNDTVIVDVSQVLAGRAPAIGVAPNDVQGNGGVGNDPNDVAISHQSDPSADEAILAVTDERGGGLQETRCNTDPNGVIGGIHFWSLPITGTASPAKRLGGWFYPNPGLLVDPLEPLLAGLGRAERACTIHVLRMGGNGTAGPGAIQAGFDGVSRLPQRQLVSAHYGAGVWHLDFGSASSSADGIAEDPRSTWGNTLGWNVMPGAETWSAKEYKGYVYAGDMGRG
ncbi:MAG TPA: hypothetical protein VNN07_01070, partial [Candidatus Tectomicrobia bacterium]|nr:hypothetical protein [Candidatus Tectomicrobia bacterium]